jgi:hypothetical protein
MLFLLIKATNGHLQWDYDTTGLSSENAPITLSGVSKVIIHSNAFFEQTKGSCREKGD